MITTTVFDPVIEQKQSTIAKDLRINLQRLLSEGALGAEEAHFALLALSSAAEYPAAVEYAKSIWECPPSKFRKPLKAARSWQC